VAASGLAVLALLALSGGGSGVPTALFGWEPSVQAEWERAIGPGIVQLARGDEPAPVAGQLPAAFPPLDQDRGRSSYINKLGSTATSLEQQERELEAKKLKIEQEEEDVQHMYAAAVRAREENKVRRAEEARTEQQAAMRESALEHGLNWMPEMGTDISFINTAQFPGSMKGAWHHNAPIEDGESAQAALPRDTLAQGQKRAALQLAVKEKVDLDAAKAEIKKLKEKIATKSTAAVAGAKAPQDQQEQARVRPDTSRKAARKAARKPQQLRMVHATSQRSKFAVDPFKQALKRFLGEASLVVRHVGTHARTHTPTHSHSLTHSLTCGESRWSCDK